MDTTAAILAQARALAAAGLCVIPVEFKGKKPAVEWKRYQQVRPTDAELQTWFGNGKLYNAGIVTGAISGVVVVDCDNRSAQAWARQYLPATPLVVKTARGDHRYYKHPGAPVRNTASIPTGIGKIALDVRGDGGYVVAPGSVHETGVQYELLDAAGLASLNALPVFDPAWLKQKPTLKPVKAVKAAALDAVPFTGAADTIPEGERNVTLTGRAGTLRSIGLSQPLIEAQLLDENQQRCKPPLPEDEVRRIVASVCSYAERPDPFNTTDAGNAEFFARQYADLLRFDHRRGRWLVSAGHHWRADPDGELARMALASIRVRHSHAFAEHAAERLKWAFKSESRPRLQALLEIAKSIRPLADAGDNWDADPWLLGVQNGVVDLRSGVLRDGTSEDRISQIAPVAYDPSASCHRWERFIHEISDNHEGLAGFHQRSIGLALTGDITEQVFWVHHGQGANGKSTLLEALSHLLPQHCWTMPFPVEGWSDATSEYQRAQLVGKRLVFAKEVHQTKRLNTEMMKSLTGGDTINARHPYGRPFDFRPTAKFHLAVNHRPIIRDESHGCWRRVLLVPFTRTFPVDTALAATLAAEAPGILAWAVRGCLAWQREGLNPPPCVLAATAEYQRDSDVLTEFLEERCLMAPTASIGAGELFRVYSGWCEGRQVALADRLNQNDFGRRMRSKVQVREGRTVMYLGVQLRPVSLVPG